MTEIASKPVGWRIRVGGLVQGVGFRPHVWRLAHEEGLIGQVVNDGAGVEIEAWGDGAALARFRRRLKDEAPPLARVDEVRHEPVPGTPLSDGFVIAESAGGAITTGVVPDAATCPQCLADIADTDNRRAGYAFTNCTHCGPRLSIVRSIPYDRARTSMSVFPMCAECAAEYRDPADRRFHAQPNACSVCGPRIWLEGADGEIPCGDVIGEAARLLLDGNILAIKGIGGFHLACDATSDAAVDRLRARKRRYAKPLAVMMRDIGQARDFCAIGEREAGLLASSVAPIVLLERAGGSLAAGLAPGHDRLGVMLPYTPLHHLLLRRVGVPLVMTSGNMSDEPQVTGNDEARERLAGIADFRLVHDRDIVNRLDDSVMRVDAPGSQIIRRARGLAPEPLRLAEAFGNSPRILAMGGELKAAFCLLADGRATLSQHMGDLEEATTHGDYRRNLDLYARIFGFAPDIIAVDCHPDYLSTQWGRQRAGVGDIPVAAVQHHHAHLASCLAENAVAPDDDATLGVILDGLGLGADGTIWGGEFLVGGYREFERAGHFLPVALPGGAQAMREPWRNTVAHLVAAFGEEWQARIAATPLATALEDKPLRIVSRMLDQGLNAPLSSSAGRLFDAVAAALGICTGRQHYEGQAAMELETLARPHLSRSGTYPADIANADGAAVLSWRLLWEALLSDLAAGVDHGVIAARFHKGLIASVAAMAENCANRHAVARIALSGGVMQNRILLEGLHRSLSSRGFDVLVQGSVPANDGGLALGQAAIAAAGAMQRL